MEVWEKINYLLEEKKMTKQTFARQLINLKPFLKRTGEIPSTQTILGYLYGKRELKIELIPYIAEVLNVSEQELFSSEVEQTSEYNIQYSKEAREILLLLPFAPKNTIKHIISILSTYKSLHEKSQQIIK